MASLTIRNIDDDVYARLEARAKTNKRTTEDEARAVIVERAASQGDGEEQVGSVDEWIASLRSLQDELYAKHGYFGSSVDLIRQIRDDE